ncbi:unnamed protein product [Trichogramma brassicae]|uniref:CCHC-type domain-containing protein n=1 Tax=Trichogramma brassicae TaxID=86971 RepID=A0A6H5ILY4_9HYME|nr:unnamed protein product [Trichogramma brassicae]
MQWDTTRDGVLPVFMPATSITPSKGAIKRPSATDKQTNKSRKSPKDRSRSEDTRTRIFTSRAATPRPKGHESALTGGLPAPLIPSINMWPAPDELTRGAPADSAAAANDILPSIELTPPEARRRDSESRGNAFSRSPKRSDSEMSDGAPTVVQVPPSQPSMTDNLLRALIHEIHTLSLNKADQMLAINMRLDQELVHRTSSNASRRSSHSSRQNSGKSESDASRTPSSPKKRASDRRQRDPTPQDGASPAVEASRSETQVPKEQRHAGGDARRDVDTTPKRTENRKTRRRANRWRRRRRRLGKATRVAARNRHCRHRRLPRTEENRALLGRVRRRGNSRNETRHRLHPRMTRKCEPRARRLRKRRTRRREIGHHLRQQLRLRRRPHAHRRPAKARPAKACQAATRQATATGADIAEKANTTARRKRRRRKPNTTTGPGQQHQATTNTASGAARGNNSRFVGACFTCQETGHRASECPQRRCFRCQETGHLAPQCPRAPSTSCQVCGTPNVEFRNCERCAPYRQAWGNGNAGRQDSPLPAPQRSPN